MNYNFLQFAATHFGFLVHEHSFRVEREDSDEVIYVLDQIRIRVRSLPQNEAGVELFKENGCWMLEEVLRIRAGKSLPPLTGFPRGLAMAQLSMDMQLKYYAAALKKYAPDVLEGKLGLFDELKARKRRKTE